LWEEAKRLAGKLERFEMRHTLRGGNKEADQLANDAMDKGMGRQPGAATTAASAPLRGGPMPVKKLTSPGAPKQLLEGYVKGGVVHLLEGDLPDGTFVNVIPK
jgi:probable phosphoglycerate mutase